MNLFNMAIDKDVLSAIQTILTIAMNSILFLTKLL